LGCESLGIPTVLDRLIQQAVMQVPGNSRNNKGAEMSGNDWAADVTKRDEVSARCPFGREFHA
jgi:hypothetical protein